MVEEDQLRPEVGAGMSGVAGAIVGDVRKVRSRSGGRIGSRLAASLTAQVDYLV